MKKKLIGTIVAAACTAALAFGAIPAFAVDPGSVAKIGSQEYQTLAEAIAAVPDNTETTITMVADVDFGDVTNTNNTGVVIPENKKIILDLNGCKIEATRVNDKSARTILNNGDLTIQDTSNAQTGLIKMYAGMTTDPWAVSSSAISNSRDLTILGGTIESAELSGSYGIDSLQNGYSYDVNLWIKGGLIKSTYRGVRLFANGTNGSDNIYFTGGTVEGGEAVALWVQNPNGLKNKANVLITDGATMLNPTGNAFSISGGTDYSGFAASITGGKFYGAVNSPLEGIITGGYYLSVGKWVYCEYLDEPMDIPGRKSSLNEWFTQHKDDFFGGHSFTIDTYNNLTAAEKMSYGFKFDYYGIDEGEDYWFPYVYVIDENPQFDNYVAENYVRIFNSDANAKDYPFKVVPAHTLKFDANGGSVAPASAIFGEGQICAILPAATLSGSTFNGWNTAKDGSGTAVAVGKVLDFTSDTTVFAQWVKEQASEKDGKDTYKAAQSGDEKVKVSKENVKAEIANAKELKKNILEGKADEAIGKEAAAVIKDYVEENADKNYDYLMNIKAAVEEGAPEFDVEKIEAQAEADDLKVSGVYDLSVWLTVINTTDNVVVADGIYVQKVENKLRFTLDAGTKIAGKTVKVIQVHNGEVKDIPILSRDENNNTVTIEVNEFSSFAVLASEVAMPGTGDATPIAVVAVLAVAAIAALAVSRRRLQ